MSTRAPSACVMFEAMAGCSRKFLTLRVSYIREESAPSHIENIIIYLASAFQNALFFITAIFFRDRPQEAAAGFSAQVSHRDSARIVGFQEGGGMQDSEQSNVSGLHE